MASKKKITKVGAATASTSEKTQENWQPTAEKKGKANQLRAFAVISWVIAVAAQIVAIKLLLSPPVTMPWIFGLIVGDLAFAIIGAKLWKKSNRLDPASEKNAFLFFMQSQLGLVVAVIAFLPLIVVILTNKNIDKKQKTILGSIAGVAFLIAGVTGVDFSPPSVEQYTEQTAVVEELMGVNQVFWTKSGTKYHLFDDCHSINKSVTSEIFQGTVANARELKNISELCKFCENKAGKQSDETVQLPEATEASEVE